MSQKEAIELWLEGARKSLRAARVLHTDGNEELALFHCHLSTEKVLKALYIFEHDCAAPKTHDLSSLASELEDKILKEHFEELRNMSKFSVAGRYDDIEILEDELATARVEHWITLSDSLLQHAENKTR